MPDISQFNFGYDADGVNVYLENIRSIVLTEAAAALDDTSAIEKVCKEHWEGVARDNFLKNLQTDKEHVKEQFETLYSVLTTEIEQAQAVMGHKDYNMID